MRPTERLRKRRPERGTALVELAVMLPLLLLLSLMVMEGGEMIRTHVVINNAAREGARFSSLPENVGNVDGIKQVVAAYAAMNRVTIPVGEVTVLQEDPIVGPAGIWMTASRVTVQHPYTMNYVPKLPGAQVSEITLLYGRAEFRNLY
jgi:Flp pilus assembly protein TadG